MRCLEYQAFGADYVENIVLSERRRRREGQKTPLKIQKQELAELDLPEQTLDHYDDLLKTQPTEKLPKEDP